MRLVFALLAVMALLVSPVTAALAQTACGHDASSAMSGMSMTPMASMSRDLVKAPSGDSCCDHSAKHNKMTDSGCAQACAASCAVAVALPPPLTTAEFVSMQAEIPALRAAYPHAFEPQGLKRPPKSMG